MSSKEALLQEFKNSYFLTSFSVLRLDTEYEVIALRVDFAIHKNTQGVKLYPAVVKFAGLERLFKHLPLLKRQKIFSQVKELSNLELTPEVREKIIESVFRNAETVFNIVSKKRPKTCFSYSVYQMKVQIFTSQTLLFQKIRSRGKSMKIEK